ncbi:NAD(P)/FAD-dependent oxidoreductase [Belliella kenyensis]|uniref:NAD(P)/FAD-dependent oxidoreductase n=1 Tax=Belliella kenyensis TaxID=1472724 RepID=A0ABV8EPV0_9BACT|nr:FAD-dependent oxidoreductase [Belliella kenyensis]MCH7400632.1 FAD-binding oxidoreductase [Belliella kenyensis]MDN3602081.1 FAD-dependent oxidoreductase [Belliella kenyensis]
MLSYWEKEYLINYDLIIIGSGIVGMSTAIWYKEKYPNSAVLILERGLLPSGASTRNAGFACFGSLTELIDDLKVMSESEVRALVKRRYDGLCAMRSYFGDNRIGYNHTGGYELICEGEEAILDHIPTINALLRPIFMEDVFEQVDEIEDMGFGKQVVRLVKNKFEGELETGKYIDSLLNTCQLKDIRIITGADVIEVEPKVLVKDPLGGSPIAFLSKKVAVCTNAFTKRFFPELDIDPGRGMIMVSNTLADQIPWSGSFHYDKGFVYFRKVGQNRLLVGGGRNVDIEGEQTTLFGINPKIKTYLQALIHEVILPKQEITIEFEWSGIMAFGNTKEPIVKKISDRLSVAVRLGGMGVAIGWELGRSLSGSFSEG